MRVSLLLAVIILVCTACVERGHVPHYILTDSPESKEEIEKHYDRNHPKRRSF